MIEKHEIRNTKFETKFINLKFKKLKFVSSFVLVILCLFFFAPLLVAAQTTANSGFTALAPIPGLTEGVTANSAGLANFFNNLYKYLIGIAAALAIIMIIWGGLEISTQDSISKQGAGKEKIKQALFGLLLVLSPVIVFSIINPSILNLSLNLPELDTKFTAPAQTQVTTPYTLSDTEKQLRESSGGAVSSSFTVDQNTSARSLGQILDTKQAECTAATNGLGVVLPGTETGGGVMHYVCQTCPPNTTPTLFQKGIAGSGPRGACQPK